MSKLRHTNKGYYFLFSEAIVQCMINMLCIRENQIIVLLLHVLIKHMFPEMLTQDILCSTEIILLYTLAYYAYI